MVSPTVRVAFTAAKDALSMVTCTTFAGAPATVAREATTRRTPAKNRLRCMRVLLLDHRRRVFGVLLMALEDLQAGFQQALEIRVRRRGDQRLGDGVVHRLVVRDLVG